MEYYSKGTDRLTAYKNALLNGVDGIDRDNLTDNGSNLITGTVTTKSGKQYDFSIPVPVTDITVAEHDNTEYPLASTILKVNSSGMTPAEKSPYVNYHYKDNAEEKTILCRVLYDAESEYGIQIISVNSVEEIQLSGTQYNDVIKTLNKNAEKYLTGNNLVDKARCVGSNPNSDVDSEGPTEMFYVTGYERGNGIYKDLDKEYIKDTEQLSTIEDKTIEYWLASRSNKLQRKL